jgi:hypothetical protein
MHDTHPQPAGPRAEPARNRVTPMSGIGAFPLRGAWTGNRGILHSGHEIVRFQGHASWLICELQFKGRRRRQWQPRECTFLYFHDEAVALAAGHRPCALCRRRSYEEFRSRVGDGLGVDPPRARDLDRRLHAERLHRGTHRRRLFELPWASLPAGAFVDLHGTPALVLEDRLVDWSTSGYGEGRSRPDRGTATVITPPSTVAAIAAGYPVQVDGSATTIRLAPTPSPLASTSPRSTPPDPRDPDRKEHDKCPSCK